jgi:hypothetical protein
MVRMQVRLPEAMARRVRQAADRDQIPMAEVIRRAVSFFFEASPDVDGSARYERAAAAAGSISSGRGDVSGHHDAHFADASEARGSC